MGKFIESTTRTRKFSRIFKLKMDENDDEPVAKKPKPETTIITRDKIITTIDNQTKTILRARPKFKNAESGSSGEDSGSDPSFDITRPNVTGNWPRHLRSTKPSQSAPKKSTR